jgi:hypothetical protein
MGRKILAGIIGVFTAIALVWVIEKIGHSIWPPPADLDYGNVDVMRAYIDTLPLGALLTVAIAWFAGSLGGTFTACRIGSARPLVYALIVGGLMFAGAAFNVTIIPHPIWFSILGIAGIFAGTWLGVVLGTRQETGA